MMFRLAGEGRRNESFGAALLEEIIYRHRPSGNGWLGFRRFATPINHGPTRLACAIHLDDIVAEQIPIPNDERAGGEIIGEFLSDFLFSFVTVITGASDLRGEDRCAFQKLHAGRLPRVKRGVGAERFTMGKIYFEPCII